MIMKELLLRRHSKESEEYNTETNRYMVCKTYGKGWVLAN